MKNTKKAKGAGKTKSTAVAAVIFGSVLALGGTTVAAPAAYAQQDAAPVAITAVDVDSRGNHFGASYVNKAHQDLMANPEVQRLLEQSDLQAGTAAYDDAAAKLAKSLGKELFGELFRFGLGSVFDVVFDLFGKSEADPLNETLNEIMASLDSLQQLQQQTLQEIEALHDAIKLQTYRTLNAHVVMVAGEIEMQTRIAALLAEQGEVDPDIARGVGEALAGSVGQISYLVVDAESGTIPALIDAFDENVTNGNDYWNNLDTYRDNVRAMLAQAVVTASAVADNWDPAGTYAQAIADTSVETVATMYEFGVQPDKLTGGNRNGADYFQVQGEMALTPRFNPGANMWGVMPYLNEDQETWELKVASTELLEGHLQKMAANYRPSLHDGKTLEQYLRDNDFPTRFAYDDSIRVVNYTTGASKCTWFSTQYRYHYSTVAVDFGTIVGNDYERQTIDYRSTGEANDTTFNHHGKVERCKNLSTSWKHVRGSNNEARAASAERVEYLRHLFQTRDVMTPPPNEHLGEGIVRRVDNKLGQGVVWVAPNNSATGYLTDFDPDRINEAAFG